MQTARRFELVQLLERYDPTASEERVHAEMLLMLRDPEDPFSRYSYQPGHFTAAGATPQGGKVQATVRGVYLFDSIRF